MREKVFRVLISIAAALTLYFFATSCASTTDCSVYTTVDARKCRCIRENGDINRAEVCNMILTKKYRKRLRESCYRRCFTNCEKCDEI